MGRTGGEARNVLLSVALTTLKVQMWKEPEGEARNVLLSVALTTLKGSNTNSRM